MLNQSGAIQAPVVERLDVRVAIVALSAAFYALTFLPMHAALGPGVVSLSAVPVALTGWLFGLRAGLLAGAIAFPVNTVLLGVEETADLNAVIWGGSVAGSAALLVGAVAGTLRDVTDRLHSELRQKTGTEESIREEGDRMRELVERAPAVLMTVSGDGSVLYTNRSLGTFDPDSARGTNVYNFVPRHHHDLFRSALAKVFQTGNEAGYEVVDDPSQEHPTLHVLRFGPVVHGGKVVASTVIGLDVTESD